MVGTIGELMSRTYVVQGTQESGFVADLVPEVVQQMSAGVLVDRATVEAEIDVMLTALRSCWEMEPDQALRAISAMSSRCTELSIHLHRAEGKREWTRIRTMQIERLLAELDRQSRIASRLLSVRQLDWEQTK